MIALYRLSHEESLAVLRRCNGLILSGGPDINPALYGKPEKLPLCYIDAQRDQREWSFAEVALAAKLPLLAICRGFHLLNVLFGGTLIADIPTEIDAKILHRLESRLAYHTIVIATNSLLQNLSDTNCEIVNSNHHQAIDSLADPFVAVAHSSDQIIEAFEWKDKQQAFLLALEWHPEYMPTSFSRRIAKAFIAAMENQ